MNFLRVGSIAGPGILASFDAVAIRLRRGYRLCYLLRSPGKSLLDTDDFITRQFRSARFGPGNSPR